MTLRAAYGEGAWQLVPCSFSLPNELPLLQQFMNQHLAAPGSAANGQPKGLQGGMLVRTTDEAGMDAAARLEGSSSNGCSSSGLHCGRSEGPASASRSREAGASGAASELWILKTAQHLGKGLKLVTAEQLVQEAGAR
jgi:hypothetical protein